MKITRQKKVQKFLNFYVNNYQFRPPFQVLIDGTFCFAALAEKFNIQDQLPKYFQQETKLLTTPCVITETEQLGPKVHGAMLIVKKFGVHKCKHEKNPTTGFKCLKSMVANKNASRYIIATQDRNLQSAVRQQVGVPLLYLHGKVPTLDPPSEATKSDADAQLQGISFDAYQKEALTSLKSKAGLITEEKQKIRKKRKIRGANPLSCKKKQKKAVTNDTGNTSGRVRKRKRVKIASHIKEMLKT